ncbi:beta strand repeat-containing protein [Alkalinema pantanalense CENA528]|uniref:beta strand repeat-containing protein n=1 Tax=Alkalinema pantanalense TaxID=1620705 RepID=UPI003D700C63
MSVVAANYIIATPKVHAEPAYCSTVYALDSNTTSRIHTLNQTTGAYTQVGTVTSGILSAANAVQPSTGKMFYVSRSGTIKTYVWDPSTNTNATLSGSFTIPAGEVTIRAAFAPNGKLYVATNTGGIYEVNPTNGSQVGSMITLKDSANQPLALAGNGDMAFDGNGVLYLFNDANLYTADINSQTAYLLSTTAGATFNSVAFGSGGKLFAYNSASNTVFSINTNTGAATSVGSPSLGSGIVGSDFGSCAQPTPNLTVLKSYAKVGGSAGSTILPGDVVEYTVTITNTGTVPATNATFSDAIPAGATYVAGSTQMNSTAVTDGSGGTFPFQPARNINSPGLITGVVGVGVGYQVTLKYRVSLNTVNPPASIVNQGTVLYLGNLVPGVVSDDPNTVAVNDATTITYPVITLSGNVFNDSDGSKVLNGAEAGTNAGGLNAVLIDNTGKVIATTSVAANGTYSFSNVAVNANYTVQVTTATATVGAIPPAVTLPSNWVSTGENLNGTVDGTVDSKLAVAVTTSNVTGINFGIEQLPTAVGGTATSQTNPGGTSTVTVPSTLFTGSTDPDGTVASYKITAFPTNATSITINGTNYTSASFPVGGVTVTTAQLAGMVVDPIDGSVNVGISFKAIDNAGQESSNTATATLPFTAPVASCSLQSQLVNPVDLNFGGGSTVISGTANTPGAVYKFSNVTSGVDALVTLESLQGSGSLLINSLLATSLGANIRDTPSASYQFKVVLVKAGTSIPIVPKDFVVTAFDIDGQSGNTVTDFAGYLNPDGYFVNSPTQMQTSLSTTGVEFTNLNTGFNDSSNSPQYAGGAFYFNTNTFTIRGGLKNGSAAASRGQTFNVQTSQLNNFTALNCNSFPRTSVVLYGTVFDDANGNKVQDGAEAAFTTGGLNAVLVDSTNKVVATTLVQADGSYTFDNVPSNANYTVQITTATATVGSAPPAIALPSNWVSTGENLNSTADGTVDSKLSLSVATSNIVGANFGIEQLPTAVGGTAASQTNPGGTTNVPVPSTLFTGSTDPDGTVASYKITTFPTNATSITIDGTNYTSANFPAGGVTVTTAQLAGMVVDPIDGAVNVGISFKAIDNAGQESSNTATATLPFTAAVVNNPNLLLVKRITAINGTSINFFDDDTTTAKKDDDNHPYWPTPLNTNNTLGSTNISTFLSGKIDAGMVRSGDDLEYTIYFLSAGNVPLKNINFCDLVPTNTTFQPNSFGPGQGIQLSLGGSFLNLTNVPDSDRAQFLNSGAKLPTYCPSSSNPTGAVLVNIVNSNFAAPDNELPNATAPGTPVASYGFVRFRAKVN